jgi:hypothetical protein
LSQLTGCARECRQLVHAVIDDAASMQGIRHLRRPCVGGQTCAVRARVTVA